MKLRFGIARDNFIDLPRESIGWQPDEDAYYRSVAAAGFEAVQGGPGEICLQHGLKLLGNGVVRAPKDAEHFAQRWSEEGAILATCIAGDGFESDLESDALVSAIQTASSRYSVPIYIETHRASITQDIWRTVQLLRRNPDVLINGDFSHWFTGLEMSAINWRVQLTRLEPVLKRVAFLHGRVGNRCCMQVALGGDASSPAIEPFSDLWTSALAESRRARSSEDVWFVPELLGTAYEYARVFQEMEEGDRWMDALMLREVALRCAVRADSSTL